MAKSATKNLVIGSTDKLDAHGIFRPDEMLISLGDVAFAGAAIGSLKSMVGFLPPPARFAVDLSSIAHIVTRIVLSERLVFIDSASAEPGPSDVLKAEFERHCRTLVIDEDHPAVVDIKNSTIKEPAEVFGQNLVQNVRAGLSVYFPWGPEDLTRAWLGEYALARTIGLSFGPNPFLSKLLSPHVEVTAKNDAEIMIAHVEGQRRATAAEINQIKTIPVYDLHVPAIFGAVLRRSSNPMDLVRIASEMNGEATAFRKWCHDLAATEVKDPKAYVDQLRSAQASLDRLAISLDAGKGERMQVSPPGAWGMKLPSATLTKFISWLDVDMRFLRPRLFLSDLLRSSRQVQSLHKEVARVFDVPVEYAKAAADHYEALAASATASAATSSP